MRTTRRLLMLLTTLALLASFGAPTAFATSSGDSLYIGDQTDNTIRSFDGMGNPLGTFISAAPTRVTGPRGILRLSNGNFLVAYQNPGLPVNGEIDQFASDGSFLGALVPGTSLNAPFAPRGIVLGPNSRTLGPDHRTLYVADLGAGDIGAVKTYDVVTGKFLGDLDFDSFINSSASNREFHPRGLVFAPDKRTLYLALFSERVNDDQHLGWVLSYDLMTGRVRVIASYNPNAAPSDCHLYLHRPEALTIGVDQKLYLVGRQPDSSRTDTDKVLVFNRTTGACRPWIDLDQPGQPHSYARALLFGPGGNLYLPMTVCTTATTATSKGCPTVTRPNAGGTDAGGVRSYNLRTDTYTEFVKPEDQGIYVTETTPGATSALGWWYLTFGATNPTTLAYQPPRWKWHRAIAARSPK